MKNESDAKSDAQKVAEVLEVVSDKIPALLRNIRDVLYSKESAENMAESVGIFYKKLIEAGIPSKDALDMARGYMIDLRDMMGSKGFDLGDLKGVVSVGGLKGRKKESDEAADEADNEADNEADDE